MVSSLLIILQKSIMILHIVQKYYAPAGGGLGLWHISSFTIYMNIYKNIIQYITLSPLQFLRFYAQIVQHIRVLLHKIYRPCIYFADICIFTYFSCISLCIYCIFLQISFAYISLIGSLPILLHMMSILIYEAKHEGLCYP